MLLLNVMIVVCTAFSPFGEKAQVQGKMEGMEGNKVYLYEIENEFYEKYNIIDSATVTDGIFSFSINCDAPQLYHLGTGKEGGLLFLESGKMNIKPEKIRGKNILWKAEGSEINLQHMRYSDEMYIASKRQILDSLDNLFYAARRKGNQREMERIRSVSMPFYEAGKKGERLVNAKWIKENPESPFGIYLYYEKVFMRRSFPTLEAVRDTRKTIEAFGANARKMVYANRMLEQLDLYEACCIGAIAPEIRGKDTLGRPVTLGDFRGQYVIIDFWNSYCSWCRKEVPWLKRALEHFNGKKLTVLGVSSDADADLWLHAIREDGSNWVHLLLPRKSGIMDRYCIRGIPHTVLIDPEGKILAKDFRQADIIPELEKWIGK